MFVSNTATCNHCNVNWTKAKKVVIAVGISGVFLVLCWVGLFGGYTQEESGTKAAAQLASVTHMPASAFRDVRFAIHLGGALSRGGPMYYSFTCDRRLADTVADALKIQSGAMRPVRLPPGWPWWWLTVRRKEPSELVYYGSRFGAREMWFAERDGDCFILNTEGS
jgi:hypothetical protein